MTISISAGILQRIEDYVSGEAYVEKTEFSEINVVEIEHVISIFTLLGVGYLLAFVIFLIEKSVHKMRYFEQNKNIIQLIRERNLFP